MKVIQTTVFFLLIFTGVNALVGGSLLMSDPSGSAIQMPAEWLLPTHFSNYFIPGLVLFITNGILSFVAAAIIFFKWRYQAPAIIIQGSILSGWIIVQVILLQRIHFLHITMGGVGLILATLGFVMNVKQKTGKNWRTSKK